MGPELVEHCAVSGRVCEDAARDLRHGEIKHKIEDLQRFGGREGERPTCARWVSSRLKFSLRCGCRGTLSQDPLSQDPLRCRKEPVQPPLLPCLEHAGTQGPWSLSGSPDCSLKV
jgi:hypothetical protein